LLIKEGMIDRVVGLRERGSATIPLDLPAPLPPPLDGARFGVGASAGGNSVVLQTTPPHPRRARGLGCARLVASTTRRARTQIPVKEAGARCEEREARVKTSRRPSPVRAQDPPARRASKRSARLLAPLYLHNAHNHLSAHAQTRTRAPSLSLLSSRPTRARHNHNHHNHPR
jgi:hypothetical protein